MSRLDYILQDPFSTQADVDKYNNEDGETEDSSDDEDLDESGDACICGMYH